MITRRVFLGVVATVVVAFGKKPPRAPRSGYGSTDYGEAPYGYDA